MKKYLFLFLAMLSICWGCSDDDDKKDDGKGMSNEASVEIAAVNGDEGSAVYATSAILNLKANKVESYAYQVVEGEKTDSPAGEVIYAGATEEGGSGITPLKDGDNNVTIYGLEGNKTYTVFFAFKTEKEYLLKAQVIKTPAYTRKITVIETKPYSIKLHVEVPKDTYFKFSFGPRDTYQMQKDQFHLTDGDYVSYGRQYQGPQTISLVDGEYLEENPDPEADAPIRVLPGYPYVVLVAECDKDGKVLCEYDFGDGGDEGDDGGVVLNNTRAANLPLTAEYTEQCDDEGATFTGVYAKQFLYGNSTLVEGKVTIEMIKRTERSATFTFVPDESVVTYTVNTVPQEEYDYYLALCGERGIPTYMLTTSEMVTGSQEMSTNPDYVPFEKGKNYKLIVVATYNEDYSVQSIQTMDFTPLESTKPETVLEISPKEDPNKSPWMVWFNIKAPQKDCAYIKYLMNYMKEWTPMLNSGVKKEDLMLSYGQYVKEADVIDAINSDAGYDISFSSWENTESMIMVAAFNEDERMAVYEGKSTSLPEIDKPKVESPLFEQLKGDWTATCQAQWSDKDEKVAFRVTLAGEPDQGPSTMAQKDQDALFDYWKQNAIDNGKTEAEATDYARTKVTESFNEYKSEAKRYGDKYRGQNRLVGLRFDAAHEYKSSYDLFCDLDYSAYNTEELFYDYGPKLFLEISKEGGKDKVELVTDQATIAPISAWKNYEVFFLGYNSTDYKNAPTGKFPVTVSADNSTITIGGLKSGETMCYPSPAYYTMPGYPTFVSQITSPIVLTKGWTEPESKIPSGVNAAKLTVSHNDGNEKGIARHQGNRFMRTALPWTKSGALPLMKKSTMKPTLAKEKTMEKAAALHAKIIRKK